MQEDALREKLGDNHIMPLRKLTPAASMS